jgi:hypothetical protein
MSKAVASIAGSECFFDGRFRFIVVFKFLKECGRTLIYPAFGSPSN